MSIKLYGIKAYGQWHWFNARQDYVQYLMDWIMGTDGAEQDRAVSALHALGEGKRQFDSDACSA